MNSQVKAIIMNQELYIQFKNATQELLDIISSLTEEELNTFSEKGGWTVAQIGEHLLKSYAVVETLNGTVVPTERPIDQKVEEMRTLFLNFDIKMNSPEAIIPSKGFIVEARLLKGLERRIEELNEVIQNKDLSMTCTDFEIPEYGPFTRLEWIHFNLYHTQRHVHQMKRIIGKINEGAN